MSNKTPVLWIAPNLNHYKRRLLSCLHNNGCFEINIFAGSTPIKEGHRDGHYFDGMQITSVNVSYKYFSFHPYVFLSLTKLIIQKKIPIILLPCERKYYPLLMWLVFLRFLLNFKLITYTHPVMRNGEPLLKDKRRTKRIFKFFDQVIFYSKPAMEWAISQNLTDKHKSHFANNTLDTNMIWNSYTHVINEKRPIRIIFLGRLNKSKRLRDLIIYTEAMRRAFVDLELIIIGDGPERSFIKSCVDKYHWVHWLGALVEEKDIAVQMKIAHAVFVPGWSGLSIVHAFAYGKPYFTFDQPHSTEIAYLRDDINGLLLKGSKDDILKRIATIFSDSEKYKKMCDNALIAAKEVSVENWCTQITDAFKKNIR